VVALAPDFAIARFQLGQLLLVKGAPGESKQLFAPLLRNSDALCPYASALSAAADEDLGNAMRELRAGLALPQEIPALAGDMQRLYGQWQQLGTPPDPVAPAGPSLAAAPMFLANYGREG
jgi:hypothetical protein